MERKSLDDILDGNDEPENEVVEQPSETEEQPRDDSGKFASKGVEPDPEPEVESPSTKDQLPPDEYGAVRGERERRQAAEREREDLRKQIEALQTEIKHVQKPQEQQKPAPSLWEDEDGWQQHFGGQVVNQATAASAYQSKLHTSEFYARKNIDGFDDKWEDLNKWLGDNPAIAQQAAEDYDPWGYAYRQFSNQQTMQELGATSVEDMRNKLREELLAEMQDTVKKPGVPTSLSSKRSVGTRSGPAWSGPKSLDDILG